MEHATLNGVPIITYGLIGVTTALLAYSVFRDEPSPKSTDSSSGFKMPALSLPTLSMPALSMPALSLPTVSLPTVSLPTVSLPTVSLPMPAALSKSPELKSPYIPLTQGGKRKRTRRKRGNSIKRTRHNRT